MYNFCFNLVIFNRQATKPCWNDLRTIYTQFRLKTIKDLVQQKRQRLALFSYNFELHNKTSLRIKTSNFEFKNATVFSCIQFNWQPTCSCAWYVHPLLQNNSREPWGLSGPKEMHRNFGGFHSLGNFQGSLFRLGRSNHRIFSIIYLLSMQFSKVLIIYLLSMQFSKVVSHWLPTPKKFLCPKDNYGKKPDPS
jgi:hypothetical protein